MSNNENEKKSIVTRIIDNIKEDYDAQREIDKANYVAVKSDAKARFSEAAVSDPDLEEFKKAKGLKEKSLVVGRHIERDAKAIRVESRANHEEMLRQQREHVNKVTGYKKT